MKGLTVMTKRKTLWLAIFMLIGGLVLFKASSLPVFSVSTDEAQVPILMYHKVSPYAVHGGLGLRVPPKNFDLQMRYLKEHGYHTISLDRLIDNFDTGAPLPTRPVVITLDDGYEDNFNFAFPILEKYKFTATIFLVYNNIGGLNSWDDHKNVAHNLSLLTWPQIRSMQKYGISFQSHTRSHPNLRTLSLEKAAEEIVTSRTMLEKRLGTPVDFIAYPFGERDGRIDEIVERAGYKGGITTMMGKNNSSTSRWRLKRLRVNGSTGTDEFAQMLESNVIQ